MANFLVIKANLYSDVEFSIFVDVARTFFVLVLDLDGDRVHDGVRVHLCTDRFKTNLKSHFGVHSEEAVSTSRDQYCKTIFVPIYLWRYVLILPILLYQPYSRICAQK